MNGPAKNAILILKPLDALEIYAALEVMQERNQLTRKMNEAVNEYKKQIDQHLTHDQMDDAEAERAVLMLLNRYL